MQKLTYTAHAPTHTVYTRMAQNSQHITKLEQRDFADILAMPTSAYGI